MKKILLLACAFQIVFAQQFSKSFIKNSNQYYYGSGISQNESEAQDRALSELTSQIAVKVSSTFKEKISEDAQGIKSQSKKILKTYSTATLKNVKQIKEPTPQGKIEVFCYIKKDQVTKIFRERKKLVYEMYQQGQNYAQQYNYAFALKHYYFANILLKSLPDQNVIVNNINLTTQLPTRINNLIQQVEFNCIKSQKISENEKKIVLSVKANNQPISMLDFTFWDGRNQISVQAKDGIATVRLVGSSVAFKTLRVNIKYSYYSSREEYKTLADLWKLVSKPHFDNEKKINLKRDSTLQVTNSKQNPSTSSKNIRDSSLSVSTEGEIDIDLKGKNDFPTRLGQETRKFIQALENNHSQKSDSIFGSDSFLNNKMNDYIKFNQPSLPNHNIAGTVNQTESGWELRKITLHHQYPSINSQATEYLVLDFSETGELIDFNIAINKKLYEKFVEQGQWANDWNNREQIVKFLEKYRTAYLTRNLNRIKKMFSEKALIIVGRKIKEKKENSNSVEYDRTDRQPEYEYLRLKKSEYLARQKRIFKAQKDIFLDFPSFDIVRKNNAKNVYGVEMRQNYYSTTYSDEGYLFLLIDFSAKQPTIYVRAWQPNSWDSEQLIRTSNFKVYK